VWWTLAPGMIARAANKTMYCKGRAHASARPALPIRTSKAIEGANGLMGILPVKVATQVSDRSASAESLYEGCFFEHKTPSQMGFQFRGLITIRTSP
jgi:hypothetical protein